MPIEIATANGCITSGEVESDYEKGFTDAYNNRPCNSNSGDYIKGYRRGSEVRRIPCTDPTVMSAVRAMAEH